MTDNEFTVVSVYNRYLNWGGEDSVFESEIRLMEDHGVRVIPVTEQTRIPSSLKEKVVMARDAFWSKSWYEKFQILLSNNNVDLVHVHNSFPVMSPSIYYACQKAGVPVVQTLHNYRLFCPKATFYRDGHVCEDCVDKTLSWPALLHACYHDSRSQTAVVTAMLAAHRISKTWQQQVDLYITLTEFARAKFIECGLPFERIVVKPNFFDGEAADKNEEDRNDRGGILFVGRLSNEKGVHTLLNAWQSFDIPLRIIGDGPLLDELKESDLSSVTILGRKSQAEVAIEMRRAMALVMPSEWYEGFPMVIVEAFAQGLPVITSRLGSMAEIIEDNVTGLLFEAGNVEDLQAKVRWAIEHPLEMQRMGRNARDVYNEKYTPEANYQQLMEIYQNVVRRVKGRAEDA